MKETSKAMARRFKEDSFPWKKIFTGKILDVGCGDDPVQLPNVTPWDTENGDANAIDSYFEPNTFSCIHGSQVIEHLHNPSDFIRRCLKILKKNGHIVMTMPDMCLYEGMAWPSNYNGDHKHTFSLLYKRSASPSHIYLPDFLDSFKDVADVLLSRLVDTNYCYKTWVRKDQTLNYEEGVECWNEFVLRKK